MSKTSLPSEQGKDPTPFSLDFIEKAIDDWKHLDGSVKKLLQSQIKTRLKNPRTQNAALNGELLGYYKIKLKKPPIRLLYFVDDNTHSLIVTLIGKREGAQPYQAMLSRIVDVKDFLSKQGV